MTDDAERLLRRYERERRARREAEAIAEKVTADLYRTVKELERLNADVERTNLELEAANQTMRDFVAVASHDLRGPVSVIVGYASTLLRRWAQLSEEERLESLGFIEQRGRQLTRMLDGLLTVSRIEAGALEVRRETVEVGEAIAEALGGFEDERVEISVSCPAGLSVIVDPDHLQRILVNYLSNAIKYGDPPYEVEARDTGEYVEVCVRDRGEGVPAEFAARLFHKFARADNGRTREAEGAGLGLSIVSGLAQANAGEAWYESNRPRGSVFAVRLPRAA